MNQSFISATYVAILSKKDSLDQKHLAFSTTAYALTFIFLETYF